MGNICQVRLVSPFHERVKDTDRRNSWLAHCERVVFNGSEKVQFAHVSFLGLRLRQMVRGTNFEGYGPAFPVYT